MTEKCPLSGCFDTKLDSFEVLVIFKGGTGVISCYFNSIKIQEVGTKSGGGARNAGGGNLARIRYSFLIFIACDNEVIMFVCVCFCLSMFVTMFVRTI